MGGAVGGVDAQTALYTGREGAVLGEELCSSFLESAMRARLCQRGAMETYRGTGVVLFGTTGRDHGTYPFSVMSPSCMAATSYC